MTKLIILLRKDINKKKPDHIIHKIFLINEDVNKKFEICLTSFQFSVLSNWGDTCLKIHLSSTINKRERLKDQQKRKKSSIKLKLILVLSKKKTVFSSFFLL